jgi:tripartite ATP-independent transporter DctP family solute receptor
MLRAVWLISGLSVLFLCNASILFANETQGPATVLEIGHVVGSDSLFSQSVREFRRRLKTQLGDSVEVVEHGNSSIGNEAAMLKKIREGQPIFAIISPTMADVDDQFSVFNMPYLVLTREHLKRRRTKLLEDFLEPAAQAKGVRLLAMWENGFRHITNNVRPVETPQDLEGIRLRVPTGRWQSVTFGAFGVQAIPLQWDKARLAFQNNEVDGQENALAIVNNEKLYEVQKYLSLTGHTYLPAYLVVNETYFKSLPPRIQKAAAETAKGMEDWVMAVGEKTDNALRGELSVKMKVNEADKLAFIIASFPVYSQFAKSVTRGKELINLMYDKSSMNSHH